MRFYLNDASLQGQFEEAAAFEGVLRTLVSARARIPTIERNLWLMRSTISAPASPLLTVREVLQRCRDRDLQRAMLFWLDRRGPFIEDDRLRDDDDYFEHEGCAVTETGLGEAARRIKAGQACGAFSFEGGVVDHARDPLIVDQGLAEDRLGRHLVPNSWSIDHLVGRLLALAPPVESWAALVEAARLKFTNLDIWELHLNTTLAREPFQASISNSALALMTILDNYVGARRSDGVETPRAREIINDYFTGERAMFTGESLTNERVFRRELTFRLPGAPEVFAPWHGKISHRFFRLHFEWPLRDGREQLQIVYLGPKVTKS